jgi:hypothetical protein
MEEDLRSSAVGIRVKIFLAKEFTMAIFHLELMAGFWGKL